jgi:nickel-type superoxide dismutase maturation protease
VEAGRETGLSRYEIEGPSMIPVLDDGDRVLLHRVRRLRVGDVVVVDDPTTPDRMLVKRVSSISRDTIALLGDNAGASHDSRHFGDVPSASVRGVVWYRYHPANQAGRIRRPSAN